jgi:hypothetical protein
MGLTAITVGFDEALKSGSASNRALYHVFGAVKSGEDEPSSRFGNRAAEFARCLDPLSNDDLNVRQGLLVRRAIGRAARQFRDLGNERLILLAPMQNDLVLNVGLQIALLSGLVSRALGFRTSGFF